MNQEYFKVHSLKFWQAYLIHMRPYLLFISGIAGISGMAVAYSDYSFSTIHIPSIFAFLLSYGFGQALTDCFQTDTDKISAPYRPLSKGTISPRQVAIVSIIGLALCVLFLIIPNIRNLIPGFLAVIGLSTYSTIKKRYWFAGPFYNAWIVALLPIMGYLVVSGASFNSILIQNVLLLVLLSFFAYANFVLIGYLKDINADKHTSYRTFAVIFGWDKTILVGFILWLVSAVIGFHLIEGVIPFFIYGLATIVSLIGLYIGLTSQNKTESNSGVPIISTVRSFILWHMALVLSFLPGTLIYLIGFYLLFEIVLFKRPEKSQI